MRGKLFLLLVSAMSQAVFFFCKKEWGKGIEKWDKEERMSK